MLVDVGTDLVIARAVVHRQFAGGFPFVLKIGPQQGVAVFGIVVDEGVSRSGNLSSPIDREYRGGVVALDILAAAEPAHAQRVRFIQTVARVGLYAAAGTAAEHIRCHAVKGQVAGDIGHVMGAGITREQRDLVVDIVVQRTL